jgi:hypothetical protein
MSSPRARTRVASLILAWFVAFIAVAGMAPWVNAQPADAVCVAPGASQLASKSTADGSGHSVHVLKCALCADLSAPPIAKVALLPAHAPLAHALLPLVSAELSATTGAPLPARGPPTRS